jgi:hypothetical protein
MTDRAGQVPSADLGGAGTLAGLPGRRRGTVQYIQRARRPDQCGARERGAYILHKRQRQARHSTLHRSLAKLPRLVLRTSPF